MKSVTFRKTAAMLLAGTMLCCTAGCENAGGNTQITLTARQFADMLYQKIPFSENLNAQSADTLGLLMNLTDFTDAAGYMAVGQIPDMAAVFVCEDAQKATAMKPSLQAYLDEMIHEYERYAPEQVDKLKNAVLQTAGNYAVMCITPDDKTAKAVIGEIFETGESTYWDLRALPADSNSQAPETTVTADTAWTGETTVSVPLATDVPAISDLPDGTNPTPSGEVVIPSQNDYQTFGESVFRDGDTAFETFGFFDALSTRYANTISGFADKMPDTVRVFSLLIPTSAGITLPDALVGKANVADQKAAIEATSSKMSDKVHKVPLYDTLRSHRGEYIYFRTDHHWTALGAYYAFAEYCNAAGKSAPMLSEYKTKDFTGFLGSFYRDTNNSPILGANPDVLTAYYTPHYDDIKLRFMDTKQKYYDWYLISDVTNYDASLKYNAFAGTDNPLVEVTNSAVTDGSVCILVKESFGNALIPFLAEEYQYLYAFDYRHDSRDFQAFVKQHPSADVIFANNVSMLQGNYLTGKLASYVG